MILNVIVHLIEWEHVFIGAELVALTFLVEHSEGEDVVEALHSYSHDSGHNTPLSALEIDGEGSNAALRLSVETSPDSFDGAFTHLFFSELCLDVHEA